MITVSIRLFASLSDAAGTSSMKMTVASPATTETVLDEVIRQVPALEKYRGTFRCAVNRTYKAGVVAVSDGDEIALIPPTSGG